MVQGQQRLGFVLIHGGGLERWVWERLIPHLHPPALAVHRLPPHTHRNRLTLADCARYIDVQVQQAAFEQTILVAHSIPKDRSMNFLLDMGIAALALYVTLDMVRFLRTAQRAQGTLVGYRSERDDEGDWLHHPVFQFTDGQGQQITSSNPRQVWVVRRLAVGQRCTLLYNPANPAQVFRDTWPDLWLLPTVLWAVCLIALV